MSLIRNAVPRAILHGVQDLSITQPVADPEAIPVHLPYIYLFAERGSTEPQLLVGGSLTTVFGSRTFDVRSPFSNHATELAKIVNGNANTALYQRLKPADATTSTLRLSLEIVEAAVFTKYQRGVDGQYLRDVAGNLIPELDGDQNPVLTQGIQYIWHLNYPGQASSPFGEAVTGANVFPRGTGAATQVYPIFDFEVASHGSYGDRIGVRISAPTSISATPSDTSLAQSLKQFLYRFQFVERPEASTSPNITQTISGETSQDLVLGDEVVHPLYNTYLSVDKALIQAYQNLEPTSGPKEIGPFGRFHIYRSNVDTVLGKYFAAEADALTGSIDSWIPVDYSNVSNVGLMNILNGNDFNGVPYEAIRRVTVADVSSVNFDSGQITTLYGANGSDGDISISNFDLLVRNEVEIFGTGEYHLLDDAKYPLSVVYDSGFSLETKLKLPLLLGKRKDVGVILGTHSVGRWLDDPDNPGTQIWEDVKGQMSRDEESSVALALRTALALQPESELYGTPVYRGMVIAHSGNLITSQYNGYLPLTLDIAHKFSNYMGAGDGKFKSGTSPDKSPANHVTIFKNVNNTWKPSEVYDRDWENGLVWAQSFDTRSVFYPAYQTAYPNDTSILNSGITMFVAIELEKVAQRVWRELTGTTDLTDEQFIERSDELIVEKTSARFDGRYVIEAETYYTGADVQRGYSWSCKIHLYGNNMKTVGSFTIVGHRMSDLTGA